MDFILKTPNGNKLSGKTSFLCFLFLSSVFASPPEQVTALQAEGGELVSQVSPYPLDDGGSGAFLPRGNQQHGVGGAGEVHPPQADRDRGVRLGVVSVLYFTRVGRNVRRHLFLFSPSPVEGVASPAAWVLRGVRAGYCTAV